MSCKDTPTLSSPSCKKVFSKKHSISLILLNSKKSLTLYQNTTLQVFRQFNYRARYIFAEVCQKTVSTSGWDEHQPSGRVGDSGIHVQFYKFTLLASHKLLPTHICRQCLATLANGTPLQVKALDQRCHLTPPESEIRKTSRTNLSACIPQRQSALWLILGVGIRAICKQGTCQLDFIRFLLKTAKTPTLQNLQNRIRNAFAMLKELQ